MTRALPPQVGTPLDTRTISTDSEGRREPRELGWKAVGPGAEERGWGC